MRKTFLYGTALATIVALGAPVYAQAPGVQQFGGAQQQRIVNEAAQTEGVPIMVSPAGIRLIQQKLNAEGYNAGPLTGNWDRATAFAMTNFQKAAGLEPSGNVNIASLHALGLMALLQGRTEPSGPGGNVTGQRIMNERAVGPGTPLHASPASVRLIQQALNKAGYTVGNLTGNWDQETEHAAANFEAANNLEPSGTLDFALIERLGLREILNGIQTQGGLPGQRRAQEVANGQGAVIFASPANVRLMKQALNRAGYDVGPVNPIWNQQTHTAVANFQAANNLEPTGTLDLPLITTLHLWPAFLNPRGGAMAEQNAIQGGRGGGGQGGYGMQAGGGYGNQGFGQGGYGMQAGGGYGNEGFSRGGGGQGGYANQGFGQGGGGQGGFGMQAGGGYGGNGAQAGNTWVFTPSNGYTGRPVSGGAASAGTGAFGYGNQGGGATAFGNNTGSGGGMGGTGGYNGGMSGTGGYGNQGGGATAFGTNTGSGAGGSTGGYSGGMSGTGGYGAQDGGAPGSGSSTGSSGGGGGNAGSGAGGNGSSR